MTQVQKERQSHVIKMYESRVEKKKNATTRERMSLDRSLLQDLQGVSQETKEHEWSLRNLRQD